MPGNPPPLDDNLDPRVVEGFGDEWSRFNQSGLSDSEKRKIFDDYFRIFPWEQVSQESVGADIGCGSGRWASLMAKQIGRLHAIDASPDALAVAQKNCATLDNVEFQVASVGQLPFSAGSLDFAYSLGVLHHVPDTARAIREVARVLKPGAPFLIYLYYAFDNRPWHFRAIWKATDLARRVVSSLPHGARYAVSQAIAAAVYWPLAQVSSALESLGWKVDSIPLSYYRNKSFYVMRTDALDRFGTRLEQRFTRAQIEQMLQAAGFDTVEFSSGPPFWCACAIRSSSSTAKRNE